MIDRVEMRRIAAQKSYGVFRPLFTHTKRNAAQ